MALARTCRRPFRPAARLRWMGDRLEDRGGQPVERREVLAALPLHLPGHAGVVGGPASALIQPAELQDLDVVNVRHRGADLVAEGGSSVHSTRGTRAPRPTTPAPGSGLRQPRLRPRQIRLWHKDRECVTYSYDAPSGLGDRSSVTGCPWAPPLREDLVRPRTDHHERPRGQLCSGGRDRDCRRLGRRAIAAGLRGLEFRHRGFVEGKPVGPEWLGTSGVIQWCTAASSAA